MKMSKTPTEILRKLLESASYVMDNNDRGVEIENYKGKYLLTYVCKSDDKEYNLCSLQKMWQSNNTTHGFLFVCKPIHIEFINAAIKKQTPDNELVEELFEDDLTEDLISDTALEPYEKYSIGEDID